jgi:hypothetical protein
MTITGTSVIDTITGGANGDAITGGVGADTLSGAAGGDVIDGGAGADALNGGSGGDTITGGAAADTIFGDNQGNKEVQTFTFAINSNASGNYVFIINPDATTGTGHTVTVAQATGDTAAQVAVKMEAGLEGESDLDNLFDFSVTGAVVTMTALFDGNIGLTTATESIATATTFTAATTTAGTSGSDGADVITAGEGADLIFGGGGANTINLAETTSAIDTIHFTDASSGGTTINDFTINKDLLNFNAHVNVSNSTGTAVAANAAIVDPTDGAILVFANGADGTGTDPANSVIVDYTDMVDVAAFLEVGIDLAANENFIAIVNDLAGDDAYIYTITNGADTAIAASEVVLIGTLVDIGATALDINEIV